MSGSIFRGYDIRGKVGTELMIDDVYDIVCAIAYYFLEQKPDIKTIAVGMDGRLHSPAIKDEVCRALVDSGLNVLFLGVCPSPALYYSLFELAVDGGLMVTASHNPKEYNGLKICLGTQFLWGLQIVDIKRLFLEKKRITPLVRGTVQEQPIVPLYVDWLVRHFPHLYDMPLSAVIDAGNGAGATVVPLLVKRFAWQSVALLCAEVDGSYPNHPADPTVEENMQDVRLMLQETDIAFGVGLDGDADRMAVMTKNGTLLSGDYLMAVFAKPVLATHQNVSIVLDIKSSSGLIEFVENRGAHVRLSPSGHAIIKNAMRASGALLGGELSCHFFFADRYFGFDDGIYAMLRLFEIMMQTRQTIEELVADFPHRFTTKEYRIVYPEEQQQKIMDHLKAEFGTQPDISLITIDGIRATAPYGWGLVRASNTQPLLCLRFESNSTQGLERIKNDFIAALRPFFSQGVLDRELAA